MTGAPPLPSIEDPAFSARTSFSGPSLEVVMNGTADLNVQESLEMFLAGVHACATKRPAASVFVDLRGLEFMNSSCLKRLVNWIFTVRAELADQRYRIVFRTNPKAQWQRRSLHSLACMAPELISIQP